MDRDSLVKIFDETLTIINEDKSYETPSGKIIDFQPVGETFVYTKKQTPPNRNGKYKSTNVIVVDNDCLYAAEEFVKEKSKCAVLNMASFIKPGGGVLRGSAAQEESLFRRTNLSSSLYRFDEKMFDKVGYDKPELGIYPLPINFGAIYSKDITVFRTSERTDTCRLMDNPFMVDVITISAIKNPPLDENKKMLGWVREILEKKVEMMLDLCLIHDVDVPILGAFGCGAYGTPPEQMAEIFKKVIAFEKYQGAFKAIVFPVIDDHNSHKGHNPEGNFKPFHDILTTQA